MLFGALHGVAAFSIKSHIRPKGATIRLKGETCFAVPIISEMCQKSLKVIKHILNYIRILYDFWHIDMPS